MDQAADATGELDDLERLAVQERCALLQRCADALEFAAVHSVLAEITAARVHRYWLPDARDEPVHLATATPARAGRLMTRTRRPGFVAHRFQLEERDIVVVDGLSVTSPERTWLDLGAVLSLPDLVAAADSAVRAGTSIDRLREIVARHPNRAGAARARRALPLIDARSRSRPETHLRIGVHGISRVRFEVNEPVHRDEGGWLAEPDLSLEAAKIALEYQGIHHAQATRMRKDLTRWADLRAEGWLVLPYGPAEVFDRLWQVRAEVRSSIMQRTPQLVVRARTRGGSGSGGGGRSRSAVVARR